MLQRRDKRGRTSLMLASANGHIDMVTLLIGQGADINAMDKVIFSGLILKTCGISYIVPWSKRNQGNISNKACNS